MSFDLMNKFALDSEAKEIVRVSNGKCKLAHDNAEVFKTSHGDNGMGACEYEPSEAAALRTFPGEDGSIAIAFTYRKVNAAALTVLKDEEQANYAKAWDKLFSLPKPTKKNGSNVRFIGRV